jgi:hypothetical protein
MGYIRGNTYVAGEDDPWASPSMQWAGDSVASFLNGFNSPSSIGEILQRLGPGIFGSLLKTRGGDDREPHGGPGRKRTLTGARVSSTLDGIRKHRLPPKGSPCCADLRAAYRGPNGPERAHGLFFIS